MFNTPEPINLHPNCRALGPDRPLSDQAPASSMLMSHVSCLWPAFGPSCCSCPLSNFTIGASLLILLFFFRHDDILVCLGFCLGLLHITELRNASSRSNSASSSCGGAPRQRSRGMTRSGGKMTLAFSIVLMMVGSKIVCMGADG